MMRTLLKERLSILNMSAETLSKKSLVKLSNITDILNNDCSIDAIDKTELLFISHALKCEPEYFTDQSVRDRDFINCSKNETLGTIQTFMTDLSFLMSINNNMITAK